MDISEKVLNEANTRGASLKAAYATVIKVRYDQRIRRVVIYLDSGLELAFSPKQAEGLEHARATELADAVISPSGLGIHFPHLDADIYLPALLEGFLGSKRWIASTKEAA